MEVFSLADSGKAMDPLRSQIARLIEVVGTPRFETEMFQAARAATNCDHMTAYAISGNAPPRLLLAANTGPAPVARSLAKKYVSQYWKLDPTNKAVSACNGRSDIAVRIFPEEDIDDQSYRYECFTAVQMMERFTLVRHHGTDAFRIHFLSSCRNGRFTPSDVNHIVSSADLLVSLLKKHDATGTSASEESTPQLFLNRLRLVEPSIPDREAQVCTAIMLGMTSEAIALKLGISVNTVLTYRKRAYGRLNISCQNELMRLVLS
jgi:DNA-binding CsgD family transcriptional regulator